MSSLKKITVPSWAIGPVITLLAAVVAFATSWRVLSAHVDDEDKHTNSELVIYRLDRLDIELTHIRSMLDERLPGGEPE